MNRRRTIFTICALVASPCFQAVAQGKVYRLGVLSAGNREATRFLFGAFETGMRNLKYDAGRNLSIEYRFAEGNFDRLPALAAELVRLKPDAMLVHTTPANLAAKKATAEIPIVMVGVADPVGVGLVPNLARPGGNITGITNITAELAGKRLELLKEILPGITRVAVLINPNDANAPLQMRSAQGAARPLGIQLDPVLEVRSLDDLPGAIAAAKSRADAAIRMVDPLATTGRKRTVDLAASHRLPVVYAFREDAEAGGLIAYGPNLPNQFEQAATLVDKIFKGARPSDLPVEQPTRFELAVNLKTAKALGVTIPKAILLRADRVIE